MLLPSPNSRVTKNYFLEHQEIQEWGSYIHFHTVHNTGISWNLFATQNALWYQVISVIIILILVLICIFLRNKWVTGKLMLGELLVIMGGLSNLIDRYMYNFVIDFISVTIAFREYVITFPALFNLADVSIVLGVCIMFIWLLQE